MVDETLAKDGMIDEAVANRFYDRLRKAVVGWASDRAGMAGKGMANVLLFTPDIFMLLWRLLRHGEISKRRRAIMAFALAYFILPIDFVPDWLLGPLGFADDLAIAGAALQAALTGTPLTVLDKEWSGGDQLIAVLARIMQLTDRLGTYPGFSKVKQVVRYLLS